MKMNKKKPKRNMDIIKFFKWFIIGVILLKIIVYTFNPGFSVQQIEYRLLIMEPLNLPITLIGILVPAGIMIEDIRRAYEDSIKTRNLEVEKAQVRFTIDFVNSFREIMPTANHLAFIRKQELEYQKGLKEISDIVSENELDFDVKMFKDNMQNKGISFITFKEFNNNNDKIREENRDEFIKILETSKLIHDYGFRNSALNESIGAITAGIRRTRNHFEAEKIKKEEFETQMNFHFNMLNKLYKTAVTDLLNDLECLALNVQWDLLAIGQIYHLIVQPFEDYILSFYTTIMTARESDIINNTLTFSNLETIYKGLMKTKNKYEENIGEIEDYRDELENQSREFQKKLSKELNLTNKTKLN